MDWRDVGVEKGGVSNYAFQVKSQFIISIEMCRPVDAKQKITFRTFNCALIKIIAKFVVHFTPLQEN